MSMIELIMAMALLAIGMAGIMLMFTSAIASNSRNKFDTTATNLSQMMLERLTAASIAATSTFTITDCAGNVLTIDPTGTTTGRGAALNGSDIDFNTAPSPASGYSVNYSSCSTSSTPATYNIRWRIRVLHGSDTQPATKLIVVSTRQIGAAGAGTKQLQLFAPPVTLRTVIGR